jgi:putative flippase GtrA
MFRRPVMFSKNIAEHREFSFRGSVIFGEISSMIDRDSLVRYILNGLVAVSITYLVLFVLLQAGVNFAVSNGVGFSCGAIYSYFAQGSHTFQSKLTKLKFVVFGGYYALALTIHTSLIYFFKTHFDYSLMLSFFLGTAFVTVLNYLVLRNVIFRSGLVAGGGK